MPETEIIRSEPMRAMKKEWYTGSHFELVSGFSLPEKRIIQIWPEKVCDNEAGYAVFLCEVQDEKESEEK